jgi:hypothetical protein
MRYPTQAVDIDAPARRNEPELRLEVSYCTSSVLQLIAADLSGQDGRPLPGCRETVASITRHIDGRRERERDYQIRVAQRERAKKQGLLGGNPFARSS